MKLFKAKKDKKKKLSMLAALCFLTALALLLSNGAVTLAKYIISAQKEGTAVAKPFYFSSDKLDETAPYYQLDSGTNGTVTVKFQLRNYIDKLRCTDSGFSCTYQITADDGTVIPTADGSAAENPGSVDFTGGGPEVKEISFPVDASYFSEGKKITVTARTTSPYKKVIQAEFGFSAGQAQLQYSVSEKNGAVVLEVGGAEGSLTVTWPEDLVPDRSNQMLQGAGNASVTFAAESSTRYAFTFLKTDASKTYSESDFQVSSS